MNYMYSNCSGLFFHKGFGLGSKLFQIFANKSLKWYDSKKCDHSVCHGGYFSLILALTIKLMCMRIQTTKLEDKFVNQNKIDRNDKQ